jgi:hypothetical protein
MKKFLILSALNLALISISSSSYAANSASGNISATVSSAIAIANTTDLLFGRFSVSPTNAGTVVINTAGSRSVTSGVTGITSTVQAGNFNVSGDANAAYTITLPADGTVTLTNQSGPGTMPVSTFTSNPGSTGTLDGSGAQSLKVGATLNVSAAQTPGNYTGTYLVSVTYN